MSTVNVRSIFSQTLDLEFIFLYEACMEKVIEKFSNKDWVFRVIILTIAVLTLHIQFFSSFMGL